MNQFTFTDRIRSILSDNNAPRLSPAQKSGSGIDEARLALAPAGFARVFKRPVRRQYANYKIALLMDASGSMYEDSKLDYACKAVHALHFSLKRSGFKPLTFIFNRVVEAISDDILSSSLTFYDYVNKQTRKPLTCSKHGDGNHDGFAVQTATKALHAQGDGAKILLVFSDGEPCCFGFEQCLQPGCSTADTNLRSDLRKQISLSRRSGVTCLSVGICSDSASDYYGEEFSTVVDDLKDLYNLSCTLLSKNIKRG